MRIYEASDFERLLSMLPHGAANHEVQQALLEMMAEQKVVRQPYTFEVDFAGNNFPGAFAAPAANAQTPGFFLVDNSAPFMLVATSFEADLAGVAKLTGTDIVPNALVFIADQSSNRNWMNAPVPLPSLFGRGNAPFYWPQPRLIPGNTNIAVTLFNYEAANTNNIRLSFHGWRYYALGQ